MTDIPPHSPPPSPKFEEWLARIEGDRQRGQAEMLVRIEERTRVISDEIKEVKSILVTKSEFQPVRMLVYGLVALIMTAVITALIAQVVISK